MDEMARFEMDLKQFKLFRAHHYITILYGVTGLLLIYLAGGMFYFGFLSYLLDLEDTSLGIFGKIVLGVIIIPLSLLCFYGGAMIARHNLFAGPNWSFHISEDRISGSYLVKKQKFRRIKRKVDFPLSEVDRVILLRRRQLLNASTKKHKVYEITCRFDLLIESADERIHIEVIDYKDKVSQLLSFLQDDKKIPLYFSGVVNFQHDHGVDELLEVIPAEAFEFTGDLKDYDHEPYRFSAIHINEVKDIGIMADEEIDPILEKMPRYRRF